MFAAIPVYAPTCWKRVANTPEWRGPNSQNHMLALRYFIFVIFHESLLIDIKHSY